TTPATTHISTLSLHDALPIYQHLLHVLAELGPEERCDHVAVGVGDHRHHDQSGGDVLLVVEAAHDADAPPDEAAEDHEIERRGHHRGHDGLAPDADEAPVLADDDGLEADPARHVAIDGRRSRPGHGAHRRAPAGRRAAAAADVSGPVPAGAVAGCAGAASPCAPSPAVPRPSTSCMKISSRRFTLLRMLSTS